MKFLHKKKKPPAKKSRRRLKGSKEIKSSMIKAQLNFRYTASPDPDSLIFVAIIPLQPAVNGVAKIKRNLSPAPPMFGGIGGG